MGARVGGGAMQWDYEWALSRRRCCVSPVLQSIVCALLIEGVALMVLCSTGASEHSAHMSNYKQSAKVPLSSGASEHSVPTLPHVQHGE